MADLLSYRFKFEYVKRADNHLLDALSRKPAFLPTVENIALRNTRSLIPDSMILHPQAVRETTLAQITVISKANSTIPLTDLAIQVLAAQQTSVEYDTILAIARANGGSHSKGYQVFDGVLLH